MSTSADTPVSPVTTTRPELTISAASVNNEPVELDATPTSQKTVSSARRGSRAALLEELSPDERKKREQRISERKEDPAVLVDIPQTPGAEELEQSGATETAETANA